MKTIEECERFLAEVGLATVLPGKAALLPCLLWAAQGHRGPFSGADAAFHNIWNWKDELPARRLAWAGRLLGSQVVLVHVGLLPALLGARGPLEVEELYEEGGLSAPAFQLWRHLSSCSGAVGRKDLRNALNLGHKAGAATFDRACRDLERLLVLTRSGSAPQAQGWDSNSYALVERHFPDLTPLPHASARVRLREALEKAAPEASKAQVQRWLGQLS